MIATIRLIRAFEGPRHDRLEKIWDAVAEYLPKSINVRVFSNVNGKLSHAECLQRMWREEEEFDNRYVVFTEFDFLPRLHDRDFLGLQHFGRKSKVAGWGAHYATRDHRTRRIREVDNMLGGWFFVLDKSRCPKDLCFYGKPDPANQLPEQISRHRDNEFYLVSGEDAYPRMYGLDYHFGSHLFWSRHYNDDPRMRISGFPLGDILQSVDQEIDRWLKTAPKRYRSIFVHRFGSDALESCSAYIKDEDGLSESSAKYAPSKSGGRRKYSSQ